MNNIITHFSFVMVITLCIFSSLPANGQNYDKHKKEKLDKLYAEASSYFYQDKNKAARLWKEVAEQGHVDAQLALGQFYNSEERGILDYKEAIKWFRMAAEQGNRKAQYWMGEYYALGRGVDRSIQDAITWYKRAANQNGQLASFNLGVIYSEGKFIEPNFKEAAKWYQKAAEIKYKPDYSIDLKDHSFFILGRHYFNTQSYKDAAYLFSIIAGSEAYVKNMSLEFVLPYLEEAGQQGNPAAYWAIGYAYNKGYGIEKNTQTAFEYFKKAADNGHVKAQYELSKIYTQRNLHKEAFHYGLLAAQQGHTLSQNKVADHYFLGDVIPKNIDKADHWYTKSLHQNDYWSYKGLEGVLKVDSERYPLNHSGWEYLLKKNDSSYYYLPDSKLAYKYDSNERVKITIKENREDHWVNNQIIGLIIDCTTNEYQKKQYRSFRNDAEEFDSVIKSDNKAKFQPIAGGTVMEVYKNKVCS